MKKTSGLLFIVAIRKNLRFVWRVLVNKQTPLLPRVMAILLIGYIVSPIDLLPDWLAFFGIWDDIWMAIIVINLIKKILPEDIKNIYMDIKKETKYRE